MKKVLLSGAVCLLSIPALAQQQGTITYERKINLHRRMVDEQMKAMVSEFRTTKHLLLFSDSISVFKLVKEEEGPDPFESNAGGGGARVMIRMGPGENGVLYKNFASGRIEEQLEFADKNYIVDDTIKVQPWKLSDDTKIILGHACKKATMKSPNGNEVSAWYAPDLSSPAGPENFSGLPGTVLSIDVNNGEIVFTAMELKATVDKKELMEPKSGKHITRAELQKKMEEVLGPPGPGGSRIFRMQ